MTVPRISSEALVAAGRHSKKSISTDIATGEPTRVVMPSMVEPWQ
jgi:hypothetical protein